MTKKQLAILATLPQVIDALNAFAAEAEAVRVSAARAGFGAPQPSLPQTALRVAPNNSSVAAAFLGPVNIPTPERAEFRNGNPPVSEEEAVGLDTNAPEHLQAEKRKRAEFLRQARQGDPTRAAKLAQFRHDGDANGTEVEETVVRVSPLNIGGANG